MAFCVRCGNDIGDNNFCASCGTAAANRSPSPSSKASGKALLEVDPDLVCPKCGGVEHYLGSSGGHPEKYCFKCDVAMNFTPKAREKLQRQARRWLFLWGAIVLAFIIWVVSLFWPEPEEAAEPAASAIEEIESEPEPEPEPPMEEYRYSDNPEACDAMLDANENFLFVVEGIESGNISRSELISNLDAGSARIDSVLPQVEAGDMYWWLVSQSNNLAIASSSFQSGDTAVAAEGLSAYLNDFDEFKRFCSE